MRSFVRASPFANDLSLRRLARAAVAVADDIAGQPRTHAAPALAAALELLHAAQEVCLARDERDGCDVRAVSTRRRGDDDRVALLQVGDCDGGQAVVHLLKASASATLPVGAALPAFSSRAFAFAPRAFALTPALASSAARVWLARVAARSALLACGSRPRASPPARLHNDLLLRRGGRGAPPAESVRGVERLSARAGRAPHQNELPRDLLPGAGSGDAGRERAVADAHVRERDVRGFVECRLA